jgi:tetratricopeptide (TPR) repeat protein
LIPQFNLPLNIKPQLQYIGLPITIAGLLLLSVATAAIGQSAEPDLPSAKKAAIASVKAGRTAEALAALTKLTKTEKSDAELWYYLGVVYIQLNDFKKASSALEKSTSLNPNDGYAHTAFAYALMRRSKLIKASIEAQEALSINPQDSDAHYTLGIIYLRIDDRAKAIQHADVVIKQRPDFAEAYLLKSQALVSFLGEALVGKVGEEPEDRKDRFRVAIESLEKYLQLTKDTNSKQVWIDQLASLRVYQAGGPNAAGVDKVYKGKDVTSKVRITSKPEPSYTEAARQELVEGTVVLRAVFSADGSIKHILILQALPNGLTERSIAAAKRIKFIPATLDGHSVSMMLQLEYNFHLY